MTYLLTIAFFYSATSNCSHNNLCHLIHHFILLCDILTQLPFFGTSATADICYINVTTALSTNY